MLSARELFVREDNARDIPPPIPSPSTPESSTPAVFASRQSRSGMDRRKDLSTWEQDLPSTPSPTFWEAVSPFWEVIHLAVRDPLVAWKLMPHLGSICREILAILGLLRDRAYEIYHQKPDSSLELSSEEPGHGPGGRRRGGQYQEFQRGQCLESLSDSGSSLKKTVQSAVSKWLRPFERYQENQRLQDRFRTQQAPHPIEGDRPGAQARRNTALQINVTRLIMFVVFAPPLTFILFGASALTLLLVLIFVLGMGVVATLAMSWTLLVTVLALLAAPLLLAVGSFIWRSRRSALPDIVGMSSLEFMGGTQPSKNATVESPSKKQVGRKRLVPCPEDLQML